MTIASLLNQTCSVETLHSTDKYGDPSYNAAVDIACRISYRHRQVLNQAGETVISTAKVTTTTKYGYTDRFTVDGLARLPIAINHTYNRDGSYHHSSVFL